MPEQPADHFDIGAGPEERRREEVTELMEVPALGSAKPSLEPLPGAVDRSLGRREPMSAENHAVRRTFAGHRLGEHPGQGRCQWHDALVPALGNRHLVR
jgi:hypothetical protein